MNLPSIENREKRINQQTENANKKEE